MKARTHSERLGLGSYRFHRKMKKEDEGRFKRFVERIGSLQNTRVSVTIEWDHRVFVLYRKAC